jgi:mitochondrial distribution and morphology protein 34
MFLRLSCFELSGIIILVFSKQKGLTLVFRNDPIDSVRVSSTFDSIPAIQRFLQAEIERLLRDLMREQVPAIIHKLSLEWAMRNQADECLSPASLTNTQSDGPVSSVNYPYSLDMDANDPLRPIISASNLNRLSELAFAQHTLSPFTTSIPQSVFRSSTSLIASLRQSAFRRRELQPVKLESEAYHRLQAISPPESVYSAQSADTYSRPTMYGRRQRSSYLRRSNPPKRKVVRLRPSASDNASVDQSTTDRDQEEYFSEPGGYPPNFHPPSFSNWKENEAMLQEGNVWNAKGFVNEWDGVAEKIGKYADTPFPAEQRYDMPPAKGKLPVRS